MPISNNLNLNEWRESEILTDTLIDIQKNI